MRFSAVTVALMVTITAGTGFAQMTIVRDGAPHATIYHFDQEGAAELAAELQHYVQAVTGATLQVKSSTLAALSGPQLDPAVLLAYGEEAVDALVGELPRTAELQPNGFTQSCDGEAALLIAALDLAGLRYGVYDLLEQIGVRWYMPAELGEHIPERDTISFDEFSKRENPDFILRDMWLAYGKRPGTENADYETWRMRNKMGGVKAKMGHNLGTIINSAEFGETHPEYFPLIDGERMVTDGHDWQPCTSNPNVVQIAADKARAAFDEDPELWSYSLSPNDGWGGWCECENCLALDPPEFRDVSQHGKGRRILILANQVAELLEETHPDRHVAFYAYAPTVEPPDGPRAHPNVAIAVAHYGSVEDKFRPITDPTSPRNHRYIPIIEGWANVTDEIFAREYYTGLVGEDSGLTRVAAAYALAEDIPWYHEHNVVGINSEALGIWGNVGLNFYLAAKMMWDVDTNVEAVLDDYFVGMYGPGAAPMRKYFETLRDIARERYLTKKALLTDEDLPPLGALLDDAFERAETEKQRGRVQLSLDHFDYVQLVRRMYETAAPEDREALQAFVDARPDSLGFDRKMHAAVFAPPPETRIPVDLSYDGPAVAPESNAAPDPDTLGVSPAVRHASVWLVIPDAGEAFDVSVSPHQMGRYMHATAAELMDPSGESVGQVSADVRTTETITVDEAEAGTYVLRVNARPQAGTVTSTARAFVLVGEEHNFVGPTPRLYFLPDPNADEVKVRLESTPPGETAAITVWDSTGAEVLVGHTHDQVSEVQGAWALTAANRGVWSLKVDQVPEQYIEDAIVKVSGALPYLATDPARLVRPVE